MVVIIEHLEFEAFLAASGSRLRRALVATYGIERGREAAAEALAYAWEHWAQIQGMDHPVPYLYRVGQSKTRKPKARVLFEAPGYDDPWVEPKLRAALEQLSERQRIAVVLITGFGWQLRDVAELCGLRVTTVQNHLERGLARLRQALEVE